MAGADWQRDVLRELKQAEDGAGSGAGAEPTAGSRAEPKPEPTGESRAEPTAAPRAQGAEPTVTLQLSRSEAERAWKGQTTQAAPNAQAAPSSQHTPNAQAAPNSQAAPGPSPAPSPQPAPNAQDNSGPAATPVAMPMPMPQPAAAPVAHPSAQVPQQPTPAQPSHQPPLQQQSQHQPPPQEQTPDPRVSAVTPESEPTLDPRLSEALGRPARGDSAVRRTGRSLRRLTSSAAKEVEELTRLGREIQQPVTTGRVIAVTSIRGGVGKTTVSALMARTFNHYRQDPGLALEMDPALGTLPVRLGAETVRWSVADLARILNPSMLLTDVTGYLVPVGDGGWLLPASQGRIGALVDVEMYRTVTLALRRYFGVTVVDCECLPGEVARTAMATAHARVVVAPVTAEGVNGTRRVLDWLAGLPRGVLATTVVALTANSPDTTLDVKAATAHLREAGVAVVPFAYDRHLGAGGTIQNALLGEDTRRAAARLAAEALQFAVRR